MYSVKDSKASPRDPICSCGNEATHSSNPRPREPSPLAVNQFNGKELIAQFERMQVTPAIVTSMSSSHRRRRHTAGNVPSSATLASTGGLQDIEQSSKKSNSDKAHLKGTKRTSMTKKKRHCKRPILRPSILNFCSPSNQSVKASSPNIQSSQTQVTSPEESVFQNFSFACSKELDSIDIRPRSSSLPTSSGVNHQCSSLPTHSQSNSARPSSGRRKKKGASAKSKNCDSNALKRPDTEEPSNRPGKRKKNSTCAEQARTEYDSLSVSIDRLTDYLEESVVFPKKMSYMAEMMYT